MPIAGGTEALLRQCRIRASVDPARAMLVLARAVHAPTPASMLSPLSPETVVGALNDARQKGLAAEYVPALLPLGVWQHDVFGSSVTAEDLAGAIIRDPRAALLYYGLFSVDDSTLAYFAKHPTIVSWIHRNGAAVFADFAESVAVRDGRVVLPGDEDARPIWEDLVGAPATDPPRFLQELLGRDNGRLAWMVDTIAHLDAPHQAFALGRGESGAARRQYVNGVYQAFADFQPNAYRLALHPFVHPPVDPAFVLAVVGVTDDGRLAPPSDARLWQAPFGMGDAGAPGELTAPWLLQHVFTLAGRSRLDALLFAQRICAAGTRRGGRVEGAALAAVLLAFSTHQALMVALERLGFCDPADYESALGAADRLALAGPQAPGRAAMFQGTLALLVRLHEVGTLDEAKAQGLARMLFGWPVDDPNRYGDALLQWFEGQLLPALQPATNPTPVGAELARPAGATNTNPVGAGLAGPAADPESVLLDGLSGSVANRPTPMVQWEDQSYRVDLAAAERARLQQMLDRQQAYSLTTAVDLRRLLLRASDASAAQRITEIVSEFDLAAGGTLFGATVPARRDGMLSDLRDLQRAPNDSGRLQAVRQRGNEILDVLLADVLAAHVYAIAIEEPESPLLLLERPARTHDFDARDPKQLGAWMVPANACTPSATRSTCVVRGSLLGLERAVAIFSLRRTTFDSPAVAPVVQQQDAQGLAESAAALNAFRLTDAGRDVIAAALARGRERVAAAAGDGKGLEALFDEAGVEQWRRRVARWDAAGGPDPIVRSLSLNELLALGAAGRLPVDLQTWGVSRRLVDGSFDLRIPMPLAWHLMRGRLGAGLVAAHVADLQLRVADSLAALKLPAALAHGVVQYATWDLIGAVQMADRDDWLAVVRAVQRVTADQIADYVSALTADGPMVPVK